MNSDVDMEALLSLAGVQEKPTEDKEGSHRVHPILKNEETIEDMQKMTRRISMLVCLMVGVSPTCG